MRIKLSGLRLQMKALNNILILFDLFMYTVKYALYRYTCISDVLSMTTKI